MWAKRGALWLAIMMVLPVWGQGLSWEAALARLPATLGWTQADLAYEASLRAWQASRARRLPQLVPQASYARTPQGEEGVTVGVSASAVILPWNAYADAEESARRGLRRAAAARREARADLVIALAQQFMAVRQAVLDLKVARAVRNWREAELKAVTARRTLGAATLAEVLAARRAVTSARQDEQSAEGAVTIARLRLAQTLGISPEALGEVGPLPYDLPPMPPLDEAISEALRQRSDVIQAEIRVEDARAGLDAARRDRWMPDLSLSVSYDVGENALGLGLGLKSGTLTIRGERVLGTPLPPSPSWNATLALGLPVVSPALEAEVAEAEVELAQAEAALEQTRQNAILDVRQQAEAVRTARASVALREEALASARESLGVARAKLRAGTGTAIEVRAAEVAQLQAERDLEIARMQAYLDALKFLRAVGRDLTGGGQ